MNMEETEVMEKIVAAKAAIGAGDVAAALNLRGQLSQGVAHHPHLEAEYYHIYDSVSELLQRRPRKS